MPDPAIDDMAWRRLLSSRGHARRLWVHPGVLDRLTADPQVSVGGGIPEHDGLTVRAGRLQLYVSEAEATKLCAGIGCAKIEQVR
jgi:hypothetical protein